MAEWQETLPVWAGAWAAVRGQASERYGSGVRTAPAGAGTPPEYILVWPGTDADRAAEAVRGHPGAVLTLVTAAPLTADSLTAAPVTAARMTGDPATGDRGTALDFAAAHGLAFSGQAVLLTARTDDLNTALDLPENAELARAPLELYDLVEISVFDHPVATGRIRVDGGLAVVGGLEAQASAAGMNLGAAVLAALADEAFIHGADTLYSVVGPEQAAGYAAAGWTVAAHLASLTGAG